MDKAGVCTCIVMPGEVKVMEVVDPFCNGDFTHRVMGTTDFEPTYGLDRPAKTK